MKTVLLFSLLLFGCHCAAAQGFGSAADLYPKAIFGEWKITRFIRTSGSLLSSQDIDQQMKRHVFLKQDTIRIDTVSVQNPVYKILKQKTADFLKLEYGATPQQLGITESSLTVVMTYLGAESRLSQRRFEFLVVNRNKIIVPIAGVFFYLERV